MRLLERVTYLLTAVLFHHVWHDVTACTIAVSDLVHVDVTYSGDVMWSTRVVDTVECARLCVRRSTCQSFNHYTRTRVCELMTDAWTSGLPFNTTSGAVYSPISGWPSQIDPDCYARPCDNESVCVPGGLLNGPSCSHTCLKHQSHLPHTTVAAPTVHTTQATSTTTTTTTTPTSTTTSTTMPTTATTTSTTMPTTATTTATTMPTTATTTTATTKSTTMPTTATTTSTTMPTTATTTTATTTDISTQSTDCDTDWIKYMDHCYYLGTEKLLYLDARASCVQNGSHLVQVDTVDEANFLIGKMEETRLFISEYLYGFWNDLYELSPGVFVWRTSNDAYDSSVIGWGAGDNNDLGGEQSCTQFISVYGFQMGDYECDDDIRDNSSIPFRTGRALCEK